MEVFTWSDKNRQITGFIQPSIHPHHTVSEKMSFILEGWKITLSRYK